MRGVTDEQVKPVFIREVLSQVIKPGDCIVLDNLTAHKTGKVQDAFACLKSEIYYLPPYSPDLNPKEKSWSKLKTFLRAQAARTYRTLSDAKTKGLKQSQPQMPKAGSDIAVMYSFYLKLAL